MESLSIKEAAARLGVSPQTVRRRVRDGALAAEWNDRGKFGGEWRIKLDAPTKAIPFTRLASESPPSLTAIVDRQARIIERLMVRLQYLGDCMIECPVGMACVNRPAVREVKPEPIDWCLGMESFGLCG